MAETSEYIVRDAIDFKALELLKTDPDAYFSATPRTFQWRQETALAVEED